MLINNLFKHWTYQIFAPGAILREKYEAFKSLLSHDKNAHEVMAELEDIYYNQIPVDFTVIQKKYTALSRHASDIVRDLSRICPTRYMDLGDYYKKFDAYIRYMLEPETPPCSPPFTMPLTKLSTDGKGLAGGKAFNLSRIGNELNLPVPKGFVITAGAFCTVIETNHLRGEIDAELQRIDPRSTASLEAASDSLTGKIRAAVIPPDIATAIYESFDALWPGGHGTTDISLAVRSSAVSEDSTSSFAGQYLSVLNTDRSRLLDAYKEVLASKYSPEAIYYRIHVGLSDVETSMAVLVLEMIDARASGVMYTRDPENPESEQMHVHAIPGLGESLVSGQAAPDVVTVSTTEPFAVISKKRGSRSMRPGQDHRDRSTRTPVDDMDIDTLDDASSLTLAEWGATLEAFFGGPQDIEWCQDRRDRLFVLQSRPLKTRETFADTRPPECDFNDAVTTLLLAGGDTASAGIGAGPVYKVEEDADLEEVPEGAVLVARHASPRYVRIMNRLNAVITDTGSTAGHFSSVAREFDIPALVNTGTAFSDLEQHMIVTVHATGKKVYEGLVEEMLSSPCARRNLLIDSPFMRRLDYVMGFISPLRLTDPGSNIFKPEGCRSLHDIIRFAHEKAVEEMFTIGNRRGRKIGGSKKLQSGTPMLFYVIDVGRGLKKESKGLKSISATDITSTPMIALLKGLNHPGIQWGHFTHFDWAEYDKIVMSGGIISADAAMFASHAVVSNDYANVNLRFGYHFVIVDTVCGNRAEDNYILFRFSGGGADFDKRMLRANFLSRILLRLEFQVDQKSDLVDAQLRAADRKTTENKLDMLGRLLGATRLMDMYLHDESMVDRYAEEFMNGRYHFATEDLDA
ncbi:PEP/pyruvate binding domain protein [Olavius algarvensis associated proteobacterium Delta 3]|nr:PEP/pyruvate binding domain protein [Olavius algarvensis associated proteobacterium Delta 3]